jgi:ComF family protein
MIAMDDVPESAHGKRAGPLRRVGAGLLDAWLPARCVVCGDTGHGALCVACEAALPGHRATRCPCCGLHASQASTPCAACAADPPPFARTVVLADYAPPLDRLVHALKFGRDASLAQPLGGALARCFARSLQEPGSVPNRRDDDAAPIVTAIPLPLARLATRGFNQSLEIARALARTLRLPLDHRLLQRPRAGAPAATLPARERRVALSGAFTAPRSAAVRSVIVVDDVMTTGATLRDAAAALRGAGAAHVINCVVARTAHAQARPDAQRRPGPP